MRFLTSNSTLGVILFFVKKTDGLLVMDEPAGAPIDVQLMWALDCVPPAVEQLSSMTLNFLGARPSPIWLQHQKCSCEWEGQFGSLHVGEAG